MRNNVTILKIAENEYRVSGCLDVVDEKVKTVIVDGEQYHKIERVIEEFNIDDLFATKPERFHLVEIDEFTIIGLPVIKFWDLRSISETIRSSNIRSSNYYIQILELFHELNILPKVYYGKWNYIGDDEIIIKIHHYGWSNEAWIYLPYSEALKHDIPDYKITCKNKETLFPNGWQKFTWVQKSELLLNKINKIQN